MADSELIAGYAAIIKKEFLSFWVSINPIDQSLPSDALPKYETYSLLRIAK
jgi:hypothetical protein